jgi:TonB family protein
MKNQAKNSMKKTLLLALLCLLAITANAQSKTTTPEDTVTPNKVFVEYPMPFFPGGMRALNDFIIKNRHYPAEARRKGIQGMVVVSFVVKKDGSVSQVEISRSVDPLLDEEALRVIKMMPKWIPIEDERYKKDIKYRVPVKFKLDENEKQKGMK